MKSISFALTVPQFQDRSKSVTRRLAWDSLVEACARGAKPILRACEKCQGLKKGEKAVVLGYIRVVSARKEQLSKMLDNPDYGRREVIKEGFPEMAPEEFVDFFVKSHPDKANPTTKKTFVTRIQFEYLSEAEAAALEN